MKYSQLTQESYSEQTGTIEVLGQSLQLCDHMENVNGDYFATTFPLSADDRKALQDQGARFGQLGDDLTAIYLTEDLLKHAAPVRSGDDLTQNMIDRMISALSSINVKAHSREA